MSLISSSQAESGRLTNVIVMLGDFSAFAGRAILGVFSRHVRLRVFVPIFYNIGVSSIGVVLVTGLFLGMVLSVEAYSQFHPFGFDAAMGTISNNAILSELGPVLAAVMLAGRVGGSMAAELGTMRVTEQIDALACLGVDPVHYLATPRFLACLLLIPLLTVLADMAGIVGSSFICIWVYRIDAHNYWEHTLKFVGLWEILTGLVKAIVFGGVLALISCYRGFRSRAGAEGVGRAATEAFVHSFITILILDFFLVFFLNNLRTIVWPARPQVGF
jgi:phospholipid/cholesterol/gamma-HCH transport system permease protein